MIDEYAVKHYEHVCNRSFDEVIAEFQAQVGDGDDGKLLNGMRAVSRAEDWENLCRRMFGPSGFVHIVTFEHGHWLSLYGIPKRATQFIYGNPILAHTMAKHSVGVTFQVPFKLLVYENEQDEVLIAYDLPSSLMARLKIPEIDAAAKSIDVKVVDFVTALAGNPA